MKAVFSLEESLESWEKVGPLKNRETATKPNLRKIKLPLRLKIALKDAQGRIQWKIGLEDVNFALCCLGVLSHHLRCEMKSPHLVDFFCRILADF